MTNHACARVKFLCETNTEKLNTNNAFFCCCHFCVLTPRKKRRNHSTIPSTIRTNIRTNSFCTNNSSLLTERCTRCAIHANRPKRYIIHYIIYSFRSFHSFRYTLWLPFAPTLHAQFTFCAFCVYVRDRCCLLCAYLRAHTLFAH